MVGGVGGIGCMGPWRARVRRQCYAYSVVVGELDRLYSRTEYLNIARIDPIEMQPEVVIRWSTFYERRGKSS